MRKHTLTILSFNQKESSTGVAVTGSESGHEGGGLRKGNQNSRSSRRLQTEPCLLLLKLTLMKDGSESEEVDCYDPSTEQFVRISGSSQLLKGFHDGVITSGRSTLMQEGAYFDDVEGSLIFPDLANVQYVDEEPEARRKLVVPVNPELEDFGGTPPASLLPLQLCEGDCDDDGDCAGGLKYFERDGLTSVPGCSGSGISNHDYCIYPIYPELKDFGVTPPASQLPLQLCEGDCDNDSDCAGALKCFQRDGLTPVPGCSGSGISNYDYCMAVTTGTKEMVAVRVIASDATTTSSESEISDAWFGTSGDAVNFKSQYEACSYNKIQIDPANTTDVSNGVTTVTISNTVNGTANGVIRNAVTAALGSSFTSQFDHVMLCLPPGTSENWIAYAYVNSWLSVYNNEWCNYVSAQMHRK
jgi:hypothetical protein